MTGNRESAAFGLEALKKAGLPKSETLLLHTRMDELILYGGEMSLLRTTVDASLTMTGIIDDCRGTVTVNKTDRQSVDEAASQVLDAASSSEPDSAYDVSPVQPHAEFKKGVESVDLDLMYDRMKEYQDYARERYPTLLLRQVVLSFTNAHKYYLNSNGVDLHSRRGTYNLSTLFAAKDGSNTSSFNYVRTSMTSLEAPLSSYGDVDSLMRQSTEQTQPVVFSDKLTGDVIITPKCLEYFLYLICDYLCDSYMIKGTSIFRDSLNTAIADSRFTLKAMPVSDELASGYFITPDGFASRNSTIIDRGILKTFLLSLYGANKTGKNRAVNGGDSYVIDSGDKSLEQIISSVDRGLLLSRFSSGMPSESGDVSGVAKNSYYIEGGEIRYPVKEVMISLNLKNVLQNIRNISAERVNSGFSLLPWIHFSGIEIFGK